MDTASRALEERRAHLCRLTPDRALETVDEAEAFVRDRGLVTRTPDSALPSLFAACHEEAYAPGKSGFGQWPATKWPWFSEVAQRPGIHELKIHNGKSILLTDATLALADPVCRAELRRMESADPDWTLVLAHLGNAGPSTRDDIALELGLGKKEVKLALSPLERCGAVVKRDEEYVRYDQAYPDASASGGVDELVVAAVHAAVVAPEREIRRWFSWRWYVDDDLVEELVDSGRLMRPARGWITAAETNARQEQAAPAR